MVLVSVGSGGSVFFFFFFTALPQNFAIPVNWKWVEQIADTGQWKKKTMARARVTFGDPISIKSLVSGMLAERDGRKVLL